MVKGIAHTHYLVVVLFLLIYVAKTVLLLSNKSDLLASDVVTTSTTTTTTTQFCPITTGFTASATHSSINASWSTMGGAVVSYEVTIIRGDTPVIELKGVLGGQIKNKVIVIPSRHHGPSLLVSGPD